MNPKGLYLSLEKEKENSCAVFIKSINRAREIRKFQVADLKLTNGRLRKLANKQLRNVQKKRDARTKLLFCYFAVLVAVAVVTA